MKYLRLLLLELTLILVFAMVLTAQTKGVLKGRVVEKGTGDGLPGVNVIIQGTYYGAASDNDGNFRVPSVNPGTYTIVVSMIGFKQIQQTGVQVTVGEEVVLNFELEETVLAVGEEVVVLGEKPLFNIEETASRKTFSNAEIKVEVVENVRDIVSMQVGVTRVDDEIHIRGGRSYENAYLVDGISVQDPLSGTGFGLELNSDAIEEVELITGGFNAEYGQAMSGIINVKTREGAQKYTGSIGYRRDHLGGIDPNTFLLGTFSDRSRHSFNTDIFEGSLGGPEPITRYVLPAMGIRIPGQLSIFGSLYGLISDTYLGSTANQLYSSTFNGTDFAPRQQNSWSGLLKLSYRISPTMKLVFSGNQSVSINQNTQSLQTNLEFVEPGPGYAYDYQNNLDNFNTFTHTNKQFIMAWTHTLNTKSFYELKFSRFFSHLRSDVNGKNWTEMEEPQDIVTVPIEYFYNRDSSRVSVLPGDGFWDFGDGETWHDHYIEEYTVKLDFNRHFGTNAHQLKGGIETGFAEMQMIDIYRPWFGGLGLNNDMYKVNPAYGNLYIQDQLRFKGLIANLGLRLDYWFPGKYVEDAVANPDISTISDATREQFYEDTNKIFGRRYRSRLSPRIGE